MAAFALPALPAFGTFLLTNPIGQAITGTALTAGVMAGLPHLQKNLDKNQQWTFDPNTDDPDKAVKKTNKSTGEVTYSRLGGEEIKHLFGSAEGFRQFAERRESRAKSKELQDSLLKMYGQGQKRQDAMLALQIEATRSGNMLQQARLLLEKDRGAAQDAFQNRSLDAQTQQARDNLAFQKEQFGENKNQAYYYNVRGAVEQNNNALMSDYNIKSQNAQNAYLNKLDQYRDEEARRSLPGLGLIKAGEFLMLGRR
jgi:hypothetical protein